jgi:hypothetical protein
MEKQTALLQINRAVFRVIGKIVFAPTRVIVPSAAASSAREFGPVRSVSGILKRSLTATGWEAWLAVEKMTTLLTTCVNLDCFKSIARVFAGSKQPMTKARMEKFFIGCRNSGFSFRHATDAQP